MGISIKEVLVPGVSPWDQWWTAKPNLVVNKKKKILGRPATAVTGAQGPWVGPGTGQLKHFPAQGRTAGSKLLALLSGSGQEQDIR